MKTLLSTLALLTLLALSAVAQDNNIGAFGISYQPGAQPSVAGSAMYLRATSAVTDASTEPANYAFTFVDFLPLTIKPFTVTSNIGVGVAPKVVTLGSIPIYVLGGAGLSVNGSNSGWQWSAGGFAKFRISIKGTETHWRVLPSVRMVKSSVSQGQSYGLIGGVTVGWGWQ